LDGDHASAIDYRPPCPRQGLAALRWTSVDLQEVHFERRVNLKARAPRSVTRPDRDSGLTAVRCPDDSIRTLPSGGVAPGCNSVRCRQIFDLNYVVVEYVDWSSHRANEERWPNPIMYVARRFGYQFRGGASGREHLRQP